MRTNCISAAEAISRNISASSIRHVADWNAQQAKIATKEAFELLEPHEKSIFWDYNRYGEQARILNAVADQVLAHEEQMSRELLKL